MLQSVKRPVTNPFCIAPKENNLVLAVRHGPKINIPVLDPNTKLNVVEFCEKDKQREIRLCLMNSVGKLVMSVMKP